MKARKTIENGVDILALDQQNKIVGIELKAVNKYEIIKEKHFEQLARFVYRENLGRIILITTTDRIKKTSITINNLTIINYSELKHLLPNDSQSDIEYIRNQPIPIDNDEREVKKKKS